MRTWFWYKTGRLRLGNAFPAPIGFFQNLLCIAVGQKVGFVRHLGAGLFAHQPRAYSASAAQANLKTHASSLLPGVRIEHAQKLIGVKLAYVVFNKERFINGTIKRVSG